MCGKALNAAAIRRHRKYCSEACSQRFRADEFKRLNPNNLRGKVNTGKHGAIGELLVCADLLARGYEVFRSVSQSCSCDIVVLYRGNIFRVESKMGYRALNGKLNCAQPKTGTYDILAIVDGVTVYYKSEMSGPLIELSDVIRA